MNRLNFQMTVSGFLPDTYLAFLVRGRRPSIDG